MAIIQIKNRKEINKMSREISKIVGNLIPSTNDETERKELKDALDIIIDKHSNNLRVSEISRVRNLMYISYFYGKTVGMRQERQKKKLTQPKLDKQ